MRRRQLRVPLTPLQLEIARRLQDRSPVTVSETEARQAAVAVVVGSDPDAVLVIRRAERGGDPWSGHMGLPGGRRDSADQDLLDTAIRETWEEVGIRLDRSSLLGVLDDVAPRSRDIRPVFARPYVFGIPGQPPMVLNSEVAVARWVPLELLTAPGAVRDYTLDIGGVSRTFPAWFLEEGTVWGMTERILASLIAYINRSQ